MNASQIIAAATAYCTQDGYTSYPVLCVMLEHRLRDACNEIATLKGENATPARGCHFLHSYFGAASVVVEYEIEPASGDGWNEPRYEAEVTILRVLLNGVWCDAEDVASEKTRQRWAEEVFESIADEKAADAESEAEARAEMRRDWAAEDREWVTL